VQANDRSLTETRQDQVTEGGRASG